MGSCSDVPDPFTPRVMDVTRSTDSKRVDHHRDCVRRWFLESLSLLCQVPLGELSRLIMNFENISPSTLISYRQFKREGELVEHRIFV